MRRIDNRTQAPANPPIPFPGVAPKPIGSQKPRAAASIRDKLITRGNPTLREFSRTYKAPFDRQALRQVYIYLCKIVYRSKWFSLETVQLQREVSAKLKPPAHLEARYHNLVGEILYYFSLKGRLLASQEPYRNAIRRAVWTCLAAKNRALLHRAETIADSAFATAMRYVDRGDAFDYADLVADIREACGKPVVVAAAAERVTAVVYEFFQEKGFWG
jgi:hypothetical protein